MQRIIDTFASEYSWSKEQILDLFVDELAPQQKAMADRHNKQRKRDLHTMAEAAVVPHMKPNDIRAFFRELERDDSLMEGEITKEELHANLGKLKKVLKESKY